MIPTKTWVTLAILALFACKDEEARTPDIAQVFPDLPLPPQASLVSRSGGTDALQIRLRSPANAHVVESYYRSVLSKNGWRMVNDMRDRDGSVVLLAEQDGQPLWVRIKRTDDGVATLVDLAGAVVADSTRRAKPAS